MLPIGRVTWSVGGFHTVLTEDGGLMSCAARGRLKRSHGEIIVGDFVSYGEEQQGAVIDAINPRRHYLPRPLVANVDQAALIFACHEPQPSLLLIDRFILALFTASLPLFICFNKADLVSPSTADKLAGYYRDLGFDVLITSTKNHLGRNKLLARLYGRTTVFCGPSGAGKSALMNMLVPGIHLATGDLSKKISRGRHTTRAVRLIPIKRSGFIVDTPGYTQVDLAGINRRQLAGYFPEFVEHGGLCYFKTCLHLSEPGCSIKQAVADGQIRETRYLHYCSIMQELLVASQKQDR